MAAADHYADNDEETPCGAGGVHRCFCGLLRSATTALSRARSVLLTSRLIPLAMPHHIAAGQPREHYDCVNPLGDICLKPTPQRPTGRTRQHAQANSATQDQRFPGAKPQQLYCAPLDPHAIPDVSPTAQASEILPAV